MDSGGLWKVGYSYLPLSLAVLWKWHQLLGGVALDRWAGCWTHGSALHPFVIKHIYSHFGVSDTQACYLSMMGRGGLVSVSSHLGPVWFGEGTWGSGHECACHVISSPYSCPTIGTPFYTGSGHLSPTMHTVSHMQTHHPKPLHSPPRWCTHTQLGWPNSMMK